VAAIGPDNHYLFNLVNFLERFIVTVESEPINLPDHDICKKFTDAMNELMGEYQLRLEKQIMIWYFMAHI